MSVYLGEVCILTCDVPRLAAFYRALLGLPEVPSNPVHDTLLSQEPMLTIYNDGQLRPAGQSMTLAFTVEDIQAAYERLQAMNAEILEPPTLRPWGAPNMILRDPDGNVIYLRQLPR